MIDQAPPNKPDNLDRSKNTSTKKTVPSSKSSPAPSISSITSISSIPSIKSIPSPRPTYPEIAANAAHVLVGVACALLDRQLKAQAKSFETEGGFTERLHRVRSARRRNP